MGMHSFWFVSTQRTSKYSNNV